MRSEMPRKPLSTKSPILTALDDLRMQVAAICYRRSGPEIEFLLVRTNGNKWTFPKGAINARLGVRRSAEMEALEEAGARGIMADLPFHIFLCSKGVFWKREGVREFAVKAYLLEVTDTQEPRERFRQPTWFSAAGARDALQEHRENKYRKEMERLINVTVRRIAQETELAAAI